MSQKYFNIIGFFFFKEQQALGADIRVHVSPFHSKGYN